MQNVKLTNYQGIEKAEITLADGVTIFLGPSDTGKSSIVRALRDWMYNATGDGHVTAGAKVAKVEVDGVAWEKGKTVNRYILKGDVYEKVGRGIVPEEIQEATEIREVEFGDGVTRRLNVVEQFGSEFMIGDKPSDNAKIIGSLSGIHVVFNALREATSDYQRVKREAESAEKSIEEAEEKVESFAYLSKAISAVTAGKKLLTEAQSKQGRIGRLVALTVSYADCIKEKRVLESEVAELKGLAGIQFKKYDKIEESLEALEKLDCDYRTWKQQVDEFEDKKESLEAQAEIVFEKHDELDVRLSAIRGLRKSQEAAEVFVETAKEGVAKQQKIVGAAILECDKAISKLGLCPFTGEPLPDECKSKMRKMK